MRSLAWGPNPIGLVPLYKGWVGLRDTHTRRTSCEYKGKDQMMLLQAGKCPRLPANHQKQNERPGTDSLSDPQRNQPCWHLDLGLVAFRPVGQWIIAAEANPCVVPCQSSTYYPTKPTCVWHMPLCNPMDCSPPGLSVHGILQAGILEQAAIPFSRGSSQLRAWTCISMSPALAGGFFTTSTTWEAHVAYTT